MSHMLIPAGLGLAPPIQPLQLELLERYFEPDGL